MVVRLPLGFLRGKRQDAGSTFQNRLNAVPFPTDLQFPSHLLPPPDARHERFRAALVLFVAIVFLPLCAFAQSGGGWEVKGAPFRATIRLQEPPKNPEAGVAVELPDFGGNRPDLADVLLLDGQGVGQPVAPVWRGEGQRAIFLAKDLAAGKDAFVYFGGQTSRQSRVWVPKTSLLLETRRLPADPKIGSWQEMEKTWRSAPAVDGAGFVSTIYRAGNAFGESADFASHFTGWLATPDGGDLVLYTLSSDASFLLANGNPTLDWPGIHSPVADLKSVRTARVPCLPGFTKIDYYQAKIGGGESAAVLGWQKNGKFETIPQEAWLHPGTARIVKMESARGWPVPLIGVRFGSYIGYEGHWLSDVECFAPPDLPSDWTAEWRFEDGAIFTGAKCERVLAGNKPQRVTLKLRRGNDGIEAVKRLVLPDNLREASVKNPADLGWYLGLIDKENPALLAPPTLDAILPLLIEFADNEHIAKFAAAWLEKSHPPAGDLWFRAQMARFQSLAQNDPRRALEELKRLDPAARKKYAQLFALFELELRVFNLRDPAAEELARRIVFDFPESETATLAKIRVGDLFRLTDRIKPAVEQYRAIQKTVADESGGRKLPAQDRAYSITVENLLESKLRREASDKLRAWELGHPMAKFESDFLLLRARMLNAFGRWAEALVELDSFKKIQRDTPCEIDADFYRAEALNALGKKDEAGKIWENISSKYPHHELAAPSKIRLGKP